MYFFKITLLTAIKCNFHIICIPDAVPSFWTASSTAESELKNNLILATQHYIYCDCQRVLYQHPFNTHTSNSNSSMIDSKSPRFPMRAKLWDIILKININLWYHCYPKCVNNHFCAHLLCGYLFSHTSMCNQLFPHT